MNQPTHRKHTLWWIICLAIITASLTMYWHSTRQTRSTADHPVFVDQNGKVAINIFRKGQDGGMQSFSEGLAAYYVETEDRRSNMGRRLERERGQFDRTNELGRSIP